MLYDTYVKAVGGTAFDGKPLPPGKELMADPTKQKQADAWREVAKLMYPGDESLSFGDALDAMRRGKSVRLPKWSPEVKIQIQFPDENSKMTAPYMYVESRFGRVPWNPTQIEILSKEWQIAK
jgi:hypothetical protein